jgi:hypothetical protein
MSRALLRHTFTAAAIAFVALGCQKKPADSPEAQEAAKNSRVTPEQSFELIVDTFRRGIEDVQIGFDIPDGRGGRTMMTGRNVVTHQLIAPAKEGEPYTGQIKVASESHYSMQRSTEAGEGAEKADTADQQATSSDIQVFDPVASADNSNAESRPAEPANKNGVTVAQAKNENERTYDLVYENGRWKLVTKLDPKTEESIRFAFDRALASQS